jgi:alpha-N-arabinofuranosidase
MACQAQLVNVIAPIRAEVGVPAWRQTIFHPFALTARYARGTALLTKVDAPTLATAAHGEVDQVSAVATYDAATSSAAVFLVNRDLDGEVEVELHPRGGLGAGALTGATTVTHTALHDDDLMAVNDQQHPDRVVPRDVSVVGVEDGVARVRLPRASWNVVRIS